MSSSSDSDVPLAVRQNNLKFEGRERKPAGAMADADSSEEDEEDDDEEDAESEEEGASKKRSRPSGACTDFLTLVGRILAYVLYLARVHLETPFNHS